MIDLEEKLEGINIIPDLVAWAQKQTGTYDVVDILRGADTFPSWVFAALDFHRIKEVQALRLVDCDPFRYISASRMVFKYRVLFYQYSPVCLLTTGFLVAGEQWRSLWLNPSYLNHVIEKLLQYRKTEYLTSIDFRGQTMWSQAYEHAFVLYNDRPYIRINSDAGEYTDVLLQRWDNQRAKASKLQLSRESATVWNLDNKYSVTYKLIMSRKDFDDEYRPYREVVSVAELPFHLTEMRFS